MLSYDRWRLGEYYRLLERLHLEGGRTMPVGTIFLAQKIVSKIEEGDFDEGFDAEPSRREVRYLRLVCLNEGKSTVDPERYLHHDWQFSGRSDLVPPWRWKKVTSPLVRLAITDTDLDFLTSD